MDDMDRRKFLRAVGMGAGAVMAVAVLPGVAGWSRAEGGTIAFRAVGGLPQGPIPAYASYVLEGRVDLASRAGSLSRTVYAGPPEAMSTVALPGLSRTMRVTDVRDRGSYVFVDGTVDDRSQLRPGETPTVRIQIDRIAGTARAWFLGTPVTLRLGA